MFKHKPKDAALLDIAIQFVKGTTIFRKLTVHEILWGEWKAYSLVIKIKFIVIKSRYIYICIYIYIYSTCI